MINGNIEGIKDSILKEMEHMYDLVIPKYEILTNELTELAAKYTSLIGREICIVIDRKSKIISVAIGDSSTVLMPEVSIKDKKLSGVRIIHTHPNGNPNFSALDVSALIKLKLDAMAAVAVEEGKVKNICLGFCSVENNILISEISKPLSIESVLSINFLERVSYIEELLKNEDVEEDDKEVSILVGIESEESLDELYELARSCNIKVAGRVFQRRAKIDSAYYVGKGKTEELCYIRQELRANLFIIDDELTGSQVRNLEEIIGAKVIDRTTLILEIFARRARSKEAKLQVEAAQLKYRLPRLLGLGTVLSRTGGGIGTRGPGEKKLEVDRRHIRERLYELNSELLNIKKNREIQREKRISSTIPQISLVGYTNAGKSTLRNMINKIASPRNIINKEEVFESDMLFATLDVTTRAIELPQNTLASLTDTVGFIRKLPHDLVESFKSTLEEVANSDLLLHVVDASSYNVKLLIDSVEEVLKELGALDRLTILVFNKIDLADSEKLFKLKEEYKNRDIVFISAKENINIDELLKHIVGILPKKKKEALFLIPYGEEKTAALIHKYGDVKDKRFLENGTEILASVDEAMYNKLINYIKK